ncbi:MAG: hypothetical protein CMJ19_17080, partial [Phycisphaeraceae bacterium]|nr:hypothetical protein [Phycisphaeraceae bacterium]
MCQRLWTVCLLGLVQFCCTTAKAQTTAAFDWQKPVAQVLPTGEIRYKPQPFVFAKGQHVRYIDFQNGDDHNDGRTPTSAWKHHPWDPNARNQSQQDQQGDTYLFKRGVIYRGKIQIKRQGTAQNPIRITSDPTWGDVDAPAMWVGSQQVTGFKPLGSIPSQDDAVDGDITTAIQSWAKVTHPQSIEPGKTYSITLTLTDTFADEKVVVSLNWSKQNGQFGGYNTSARPGNIPAKQGTYTFELKPRDKADLGGFSLAVYRSTSGSWQDRTALGICNIPLTSAKKTRSVATHTLIPEPQKVWYVDLDFAPRNVWMINADKQVTRIPLARTPNWKVQDTDDIKRQWWQFDNPGNPHFKRVKVDNSEYLLGIDTKHLTESPDYYDGAYVWTEYGWVMGTPYPSRIRKFFPDRKGMAIKGQWGGGAGGNHLPRYSRYYLENKPQFLDDPDGEFWFEKRGSGGRLFIRLPGDQNPNEVAVEVAKHATLIDAESMNHLQISNLSFGFTNTWWDLDASPFANKDVDPACIRLLGHGDDIRVTHNRFEHVNLPVRLVVVGDGKTIDRVRITDNVIRYTDHGAMQLLDGSSWGQEYPTTQLLDVKVLRNKLQYIGMRPTSWGQGHAIDILCAQTCEVAGNVLNKLYGAGIFVYGGKRSAARTDRPLSRILIHHNQVTDSLLNNNDWGGIETWQAGPAYVYNNVSGNPGGYKLWGIANQPKEPGTARFGHAYYMDGGYKQYYFNNIAWGKSNDPYSPLGNTAAFQEIHGYQTNIFNNTAYNFVIGSRRQAPVAGQNKYMGNIWDSIGYMVFRHAKPSRQQADPNARDVGTVGSEFEHATNAYVNNLFYKLPTQVGVFEPTGVWYPDLDSFASAMQKRQSIGNVGHVSEQPVLRNAPQHDFRPTQAAVDQGVKVFVPWALYAVVGEWHFYHAGDDPTRIPDEHFHLSSHYVKRTDYHHMPRFPLTLVNADVSAYQDGPLEDWTKGSLTFDGQTTYATLTEQTRQQLVGKVESPIVNKPSDWVQIEAPAAITVDQPMTVSFKLRQSFAGKYLRADLHWLDEQGKFSGLNAWGGKPQLIS